VTKRPFDEKINGGGITLGFPITDDLTFQVNYKIAVDEISNTVAKTAAYFPNGTTLTSSVGYGIAYSGLDSRLDPHDGLYAAFSQDFAGAGGDTQYMRSVADAQYYREIIPGTDVVGLVRVTGGNITGLGQPVRTLDNFFKGGETVRGFASYGFGAVANNGDGTTTPIGGKNYWASTAEVQFPLPGIPPDFGLKGAAFFDAGSLWGVDAPAGAGAIIDNNTIRTSAGVSVLWNSPIGLLRADFAQALTKANTDDTEWFRFSAGKRF
jgi:outer membrane protein insertion porin family